MRKWAECVSIWALCVLILAACQGPASPDDMTQSVPIKLSESSTNRDAAQGTGLAVKPGLTEAAGKLQLPADSQDRKAEEPKQSPSTVEPLKESESGQKGTAAVEASATYENRQQAVQESGATPTSETIEPAAEHPQKKAAEMKETIKPQLVELMNYYEGRLDALFNEAIAAEKGGKASKESLDRYLQQAAALQEESDAKVNQILFQMKDDLIKQNLPSGGVDELRSAYNSELKNKQRSMKEKANTLSGK